MGGEIQTVIFTRPEEQDEAEAWSRDCDGFLGVYNPKYMYILDEYLVHFMFDNEQSAMMFTLRWL